MDFMILWDKVVSLSGDWVSREEAERRIRELEEQVDRQADVITMQSRRIGDLITDSKHTALLGRLEMLAYHPYPKSLDWQVRLREIIEQEKGDER